MNNWIKVSDRLPEPSKLYDGNKSDEVLLFSKNYYAEYGKLDFGFYDHCTTHKKFYSHENSWITEYEITHRMPLPEVPEDDKK